MKNDDYADTLAERSVETFRFHPEQYYENGPTH
jgi:hypothetical protein